MKNDYIWDKTGSDPEIERIEGLLMQFRHTSEPTPESNVIEFPLRKKGRVQPLILAMAASVLVGAVAVGFWVISTPTGPGEMAAGQPVVTIQNPIAEDPKDRIPDGKAALLESRQPAVSRVPVQKAVARRPKLKSGRSDRPASAPALTKEERHAYNQLMLALAITSSNLKTVRESIDGPQEADAVNK